MQETVVFLVLSALLLHRELQLANQAQESGAAHAAVNADNVSVVAEA